MLDKLKNLFYLLKSYLLDLLGIGDKLKKYGKILMKGLKYADALYDRLSYEEKKDKKGGK